MTNASSHQDPACAHLVVDDDVSDGAHHGTRSTGDPDALTSSVTLGDCLAALQLLPARSVDTVATDPPYAIDSKGMMLGQVSPNYHLSETHSRGYADNDPHVFQEWCGAWARECLRVLKPGGHLIAFGGTRTVHRLACALEDAGFEIRDQIIWLHGGGMPRGWNLKDYDGEPTGWSTTVRPMHEPAVLARKPVEGRVEDNFARYGTGALHIEASRFGANRWPVNVFVEADVAESLGRAGTAFFSPKPDKKERPAVDGVTHTTVKPLGLMRALLRLATPVGGMVLDPFAGSGTTVEAAILEGMRYIAIEREPKYMALIEARVERALDALDSSQSQA